MTAPDCAARAAAGAAFLDGHAPGWAERINPGQLDMGSDFHCILGQLRGRYVDALDDFSLDTDSEVALGFNRQPSDPGGIWRHLDAAWAAEVAARRQPAQAAS